MIPQPTSRTCFVCGRENPYSLRLQWFNNPEANRVEADLVIPDQYNSYPGVAHGGVVAAILDETAGRSLMLDGNFDNLFVTLKLEVKYRKITPTNTPLRVFGRILRQGKNRAQAVGELCLADGTVTATCTAVLVSPPKEVTDRWKEEKPYWDARKPPARPGQSRPDRQDHSSETIC
ncbi:MAG: PaaI family thioesterase [Desulfobacterales bacterium]|nr:PaaI family thioesterase [Desulfobacterales bacterium]MDD4073092.1 PaaI family thioesterase [Desulfobacterales bacterium]MDD4393488.1 PaaI family thioesterase [Desulfobacterales bacterium]